MLQEITWGNYLLTIGIITALYYAWVLFVYYQNDIRQLLSSEVVQVQKQNTDALYLSRQKDNDANTPTLTAKIDTSHALITSIEDYLTEAAILQSPKEEMLFGLQQLIKNGYGHLKHSPEKFTIEKYIQAQFVQQLNVSIGTDELQQLWT